MRTLSRLFVLFFASPLSAQVPPEIAMERSGYVAWLKSAANSPLAAVAQQPIGDGVRIGPAESDIPLPGVEEHRVFPSGAALLVDGPGGRRTLSRGQPIRLGDYTLYLLGSPPSTVLMVFGERSGKEPPGYYPYHTSLVFTGSLVRSSTPSKARVLASDGIEVEATEIGTFVVPLGGNTPLRVLRIPLGGGEESDLEIFFRDETNGNETYPAGRFVSLVPLANGQFRLDFNRARNPFCAYNAVYACPLPWRGNTIAAPVRAGERYTGGGLENPPSGESR